MNAISSQKSMEEILHAVWRMPRDLISDGYDCALQYLGEQMPMMVHEYPTGTECFTWVVPEKWTCTEAYLETLEGQKIFSTAENPLHVVSYSLPFEGIITREELLPHLHVHPRLAEAVPFVFKYYQRDWGLCCSRIQREALQAERYRVVIRTRFEPGTLKVGEIVLPGRNKENFVLCAHLCHPAMVNDDLTGVVVGLDVMRELARRKDLRYTYRLLLLPETIGSAAYLSHHPELIPDMIGGLFLEMLGTPHVHALQHSYQGDTEIDLCAELIMREDDPESWSADFMKVILNDERMFNSPGIRVPMVSLSRVLPKGHPDWPYQEYHSSADTPEKLDWDHLRESRDLLLRIIEALEQNFVPSLLYQGELFCSRYPAINYRAMRDLIHSVPYEVDGRQNIARIAAKTGFRFSAVKNFLNVLAAEKLLRFDEPKRNPDSVCSDRSSVRID